MSDENSMSEAMAKVKRWGDLYLQADANGQHELASFRAGLVAEFAYDLKEIADNYATKHAQAASRAHEAATK